MTDIVLQNVCKRFGETRVLTDFSARFAGGRVTCLMGPSGCGKTTVLNLLMGFLAPDAGSVTGVPERLSAVFQEDRLCEDFSAAANIRLVTGKAVPEREIAALLARLGLAESRDVPARELSGGMRRRAALARALLSPGWQLMLLDEPFKGLDPAARATAAGLVRELSAGRTVLCATHDAAEAALLDGTILRL